MTQEMPATRRTFRITIDVETALNLPGELERLGGSPEMDAEWALVAKLLGRPDALERLLERSAATMVEPALRMLQARYGAAVSEQELLRPIIEELEPAEREAFVVGKEDAFFGDREACLAYDYEACSASVKRVEMREVGE